jgi:hypothetical protein
VAVANFFLIDQSLRDDSGHHCEYAQCVARAANEMGFVTTIGAHRRLPQLLSRSKTSHPTNDRTNGRPSLKLKQESSWPIESLDDLGSVRRVFHNTVYHGDSYLAGLQQMARSKSRVELPSTSRGSWAGMLSRVGFYRHWRRRENFVRRFAVDCERLFRNTLFTPQDHAFLATVSELELMGLALFLSNYPRAMRTQWHLQFHFNLFNGRPPEYERQSATARAVRGCFLSALSRLSHHAVSFYTTSNELADQYNRLGVGDFEPLPYPVASEFSPLTKSRLAGAQQLATSDYSSRVKISLEGGTQELRNKITEVVRPSSNPSFPVKHPADPFFETTPIRVTCPGGIRREKGHENYLQSLIDEIYEPLLATGRVQLQLQRPVRKLLRKEKIELKLPDSAGRNPEAHPLVYHQHPLPKSEYSDLIRRSDVGLLFYDSSVYYSRRAGVLCELLSCGKPIIVPAGCWLAEQIQEPIFAHADSVIDGQMIDGQMLDGQMIVKKNRRAELADLRWESCNVPMHGGILSFDADRHPFNFEFPVEPSETAVGFRFDWHWPNASGVYCRIELKQFDSSGRALEETVQVVGHRGFRKPIALFDISPDAATLKFSLKNAFHDSSASIKHVELIAISQTLDEFGSATNPRGAIGVIAADRFQLSNCLIEVIENLDHYQRTAESFSHQWYAQHDPSRTVAHLVAQDSITARVA